jgi:hypothetical protein
VSSAVLPASFAILLAGALLFTNPSEWFDAAWIVAGARGQGAVRAALLGSFPRAVSRTHHARSSFCHHPMVPGSALG